MSTEANFYIHTNDNKYIYFYWRGGSSEISRIVSEVIGGNYETRYVVSDDKAIICTEVAKQCIEDNKSNIEKYKRDIEIISSMANNSVEEKLEAINDYTQCIDECKENIDSLEFAKSFFAIVAEMADLGKNEGYEIVYGFDWSPEVN